MSHVIVPFTCRKLVDCLILLQENKQILAFYNNFDDFRYFVSSVSLHFKTNINASVHILTFRRQDIDIQTLLKKAQRHSSDNVYYEYSAGLYINTLAVRFPCFVQTYGIYYSSIKDSVRFADLKRLNVTSPKMYEVACVKPMNLRLMIQYIEGITLEAYVMREEKNLHFISNMIQILFQIYGPLAAACDVFTHYDLHNTNVLVYTLPENKYIDMEYRYDTHIIQFKTSVIVKIIDYGRAFCPQSDQISQRVCQESKCADNYTCGREFGFAHLYKNRESNGNYVHSYKKNKSHDLRLTQFIKREITGAHEPLTTLLNNVVYEGFYGTPEVLGTSTEKAYNVEGFLAQVTTIVLSPMFLTSNQLCHSSMTHRGTMIIDMTGKYQMTFVPAV
jgi:hypothetical protein